MLTAGKFGRAGVVVCLLAALNARPVHGQVPQAEECEPFAQIFSTSVVPGKIHKSLSPSTATVTVKVIRILPCGSHLPLGARVTVEVATFFDAPDGNNVDYHPLKESLPLNSIMTVFTLKVAASKETTTGYLIVQAVITSWTKGMNAKWADDPGAARAKIETVAP